MKKTIILFSFLLFSIFSFSQIKGDYIITRTERYDYKKNKWQYTSSNENVEIPVTMLSGFIHIKAQADGYIYYNTKTESIINEPNFKGVKYDGYDFTLEQSATVCIVVFKNGISAISIIFPDMNVNIIYLLKE
jgi:hypothetical protein